MASLNTAFPFRRRWRFLPLIAAARDRQRRRRRRVWLALAVLAVAAAGAAYGLSGGADSHATDTVRFVSNPCRLLANAEVAKVLRNPVAVRISPYKGTCTWKAAPFSNCCFNGNTFTVDVASVSRADFDEVIAANRAHGNRLVPVPGVGQAAYRATGPGYALLVFGRGHVFTLQAPSSGRLGAEEQLATLMLRRVQPGR